jgi:hypothetical protein
MALKAVTSEGNPVIQEWNANGRFIEKRVRVK